MAVSKLHPYPILTVLKLMKTAKPLGAKQALAFYTAPLKWIAYLGRVKYYDLLPTFLTLKLPYGTFSTRSPNVFTLVHEVREIYHILSDFIDKDTVLAVEPNPYALIYLRANIALNNCSNVIIVPKATGDRRGLTELRIPKRARNEEISDAGASIVWSSKDFEEFRKALSIKVELDTLDNIVDQAGLDTVDFIKIDVEGAEGLVVKGAEKTLKKAKALLIEVWPRNSEVLGILYSLGYKLRAVFDYVGYKNYLLVKSYSA
jgi:FkbM family methyltransferase